MGSRGPLTVTYIDSSAVLRLIFQEGEQAAIRRSMRANPITSTLTRLEVSAAIHSRRRQGDLSTVQADGLIAGADVLAFDVAALLAVNERVLIEAGNVVAHHAVRSLDAIHLATAVLAQQAERRPGAGLTFCTADRRQGEAAEQLFGSDHVIMIPPWR
jgi:predicted nucleic acid-binding protein